MKIELNTNICPIIIPDTYGYGWQYENIDDWEQFKELMVEKAEGAIRYALDDLGIGYKSLTIGKFNSPQFYNYGTDWIDFDLEICDDYIPNIKIAVRDNEDDFFRFAEKHFGSYDGFISFYPYTKEEFYDSEKYDYILSMWIMYRMDKENDIREYRREYMYDVWEYAMGNGYVLDEEDEDEEMY